MRRSWESRGVEIVEGTDEGFDFDARYTMRTRTGTDGVSYTILGYQIEPDEDTEWSGYYNRTGRIAVRMVGDDHIYFCDPDDMVKLEDLDYCAECGQVGCCADGRDRETA